MPRDDEAGPRKSMREYKSDLENAKIAAQDRRAGATHQLRNRQCALEAAASALGQGASAKQILDMAQELLVWLDKE